MKNSLIKRKKKAKLLWALTAIPVLVAGTVAASCGPVMNNSQGQSGEGVEPDQTPGGQEPGTGLPGDQDSSKPEKPNSDPEVNRRKFNELKHEFEQKLVVNKNSSSINGRYVTLENIGEYIDVLKGVDAKTGRLEYGAATIFVSPITIASNSSTIINVNMSFTAYENSAEIKKSFGGFIEEAPYLHSKLVKYVNNWNYWMFEDHRQILSNMYSTQIYNEHLFRQYITIQIDSEYDVKFDEIRWPSTSSIEATLSIGLKNWNTIPRVKKVIRYDGFKKEMQSPFAAFGSQLAFNDKLINTADLDYTSWHGARVDWSSQRTKTNLEKALLNAANKVASPLNWEWRAKNQVAEMYGLKGLKDADGTDTWKVEIKLANNWYETIQRWKWWEAVHDCGRYTDLNHGDDVAYLKEQGWHPEFKLVVKSKKVPNLSLEHTFWLVGPRR